MDSHQTTTPTQPLSGESLNILSRMTRNEWKGSINTFKGFSGTRPEKELNNANWQETVECICPNEPALLTDKKQGQYFVPCRLKDAPLIGKTLEFAQQNGQPTTSKMRSKIHVTEAMMLVMDLDGMSDAAFKAGLAKIKADGLTYLAYSIFSHGNPQKPDVRARLVSPVDGALNVGDYSSAWHGFDNHYFDGQAGKSDASGANLYQQQGTWCCDPSRKDLAQTWKNDAGVASAAVLITLGKDTKPLQSATEHAPKVKQNNISNNIGALETQYPASDANKVADACKQIQLFKDNKGSGQSEPVWNDCLGVVGHCVNGEVLCQDWSSGHEGYSATKTASKLANRKKYGPTTCDQFRKTNPDGCNGCFQTCKSPITLGWATPDPVKPSSTANQVIEKPIAQSQKMRNNNKGTNDGQLPFKVVEPAANSVDPSQLLNEITRLIKNHIILDAEQAEAVALWIALTWFVDHVEVLPLLIINAPEKACGKTQLLDLVGRMSANSLPVANITTAALFRAIDKWQPTILIDEADTFIREKNDLKGLINAGHTRSSAYVVRSIGETHEPKSFNVWAAKGLAGIALERHFSDATMSRAIIINMRRKFSGEKVQRIRHADSRQFDDIKSKLARFAMDYGDKVSQARPDLPNELSDRAQDNWEPLLAIAECASPEWIERATSAALKLSSTSDSSVSIGAELLSDIQQIFASKQVDKTSTIDLIQALTEDDEAPWPSFNRGKPMTPRQLGSQLGKYGIKSRTVRKGNLTPKGYYLEDFRDAFASYLTAPADVVAPEILPTRRNVSPEALTAMGSSVADNSPLKSSALSQTPQNDSSHIVDTLEPLSAMNCGVVADVAANPEKVQEFTSLDDC